MNLHVKPNDKTGFWEIHDACGYLCKLESESTAALIVHAVKVLPALVTALEGAKETIKALDDDFDLRPSYVRACAALKDANDINPPPALRSRLKPERRNP